MLPIGWNITFTILLIIESLHRTKFMFHKIWGEKTAIHVDERNFQVILDIVVDLFFLIIPLVILWFGYRMAMSIGEILQIIFRYLILTHQIQLPIQVFMNFLEFLVLLFVCYCFIHQKQSDWLKKSWKFKICSFEKFVFSKKATKNDKIFTVNLALTT